MSAFYDTFRIFSVASLLALPACELSTKLGNLSDSGSTSEGTTSDGTTSEGHGTTSGGTATDGTSSEGMATTLVETTTPTTVDTDWGNETDTSEPVSCDDVVGEEACKLADCATHYGVAYDFPGCSEGQVYLGCSDPQDCVPGETTFCKDGTDEVYKTPDGCHPNGYTECEPPTFAFCGQCEALDEAECLADPVECQPIYGAPHVEVDGETCVDYDHQKFLICQANGGACPPEVPTVCPKGQPDEAYDVPSGCVPQTYEKCEGAGTPTCM